MLINKEQRWRCSCSLSLHTSCMLRNCVFLARANMLDAPQIFHTSLQNRAPGGVLYFDYWCTCANCSLFASLCLSIGFFCMRMCSHLVGQY